MLPEQEPPGRFQVIVPAEGPRVLPAAEIPVRLVIYGKALLHHPILQFLHLLFAQADCLCFFALKLYYGG